LNFGEAARFHPFSVVISFYITAKLSKQSFGKTNWLTKKRIYGKNGIQQSLFLFKKISRITVQEQIYAVKTALTSTVLPECHQ